MPNTKLTICLFVFLNFLGIVACAQQLDSIAIKYAKKLLDNEQPTLVLSYCDSIKHRLSSIQASALYPDLLNIEATAFRRIGKISNALNLHFQVLNIRLNLFGTNSLPVANTYQNLGNCFLDSDQPDKAIVFLEKAKKIKIQRFSINHFELSAVYSSLGYAHQLKKNWQQAEQYLKQALVIKQTQTLTNPESLIPTLISLGNLFFEQGQFEVAQDYFRQGLEIQKTNYIHKNTALLFNNLGNCAAQLYQSTIALSYYQEALKIYETKTFEVPPIQFVHIYQNIGNSYLENADMDEAMRYYELALSYCDKMQNPNIYFNLLNTIGLCYRYQNQLDKAISKFEAILQHQQLLDPFLLAKLYENLSNCYFDNRIWPAAAYYVKQAIEVSPIVEPAAQTRLQVHLGKIQWKQGETAAAQKIFTNLLYTTAPKDFFLKAQCLFYLAQIHIEEGDGKLAAQVTSKALNIIKPMLRQETPSIYGSINASLLLLQAEAQAIIANTTASTLDWEKTLEKYLEAETYIQEQQEFLVQLSSQLYWNDHYDQLYDGIVTAGFALASCDNSYYTMALKYMERSKAAYFKRTLAYQQTKTNLLQSDSLSRKERNLQTKLLYLENAIFQEAQKGVLANEDKNKQLYQQQFALQQELKALTSQFQAPYTARLKVTPNNFSVTDWQQHLLPEQCIVNYHITKSNIYIIVLDADSLHALALPKPTTFEKQLLQLYETIQISPNDMAFPDSFYVSYTNLAHSFYQQLLKPIEPRLRKQILLIPDKLLVYLPFEVLLRQPPKTVYAFHQHDYALRHYQFSYNASIQLWALMKVKHSTLGTSFLGIAPSFDEKSGLAPLSHNEEEIKIIQKIWRKGKTLRQQQAQKDQFLRLLSQHNIIHFATHGVANAEFPNFSYLAFAYSNDTLLNNRLYAAEIYQLSIPAELVFLSACQTSIGKYHQSEGLISLARAFTFAGAKSIIATLWSINDQQTSFVATEFYRNLKLQKTKSQALQQAKLHYLSQSSNSNLAHPYYWSAMILMGDDKAITLPPRKIYPIAIIGVAVAILSLAAFVWTKKQVKNIKYHSKRFRNMGKLTTCTICFLFLAACSTTNKALQMSESERLARANTLAQKFIITDGHVDLPYRLTVKNFKLEKEFLGIPIETQDGDFDYTRAKKGGLDAPFMSIYIPASYQEKGGAKAFADQLIDMVSGIAAAHPDKFSVATSPNQIEANSKRGIISLPMGMENGAPIENDLANVAYFHQRGIRYITLTHSKDNQICDSSYDTTRTWNGLSPFGKSVVQEMNRVGIMVDISHVSDSTFYQVMSVSKAPCIASHSSCRAFTPDFERNMNDDMIRLLAKKGGVIQINFGSTFLDGEIRAQQEKKRTELADLLSKKGLKPSDEAAKPIIEVFRKNNPTLYADVKKVADHIDHVVKLVGADYVGFGSDFDGVGDTLPTGLKDVSQFPNLIAELLRRGYTDQDIEKICYLNVARVWRAVEEVAASY